MTAISATSLRDRHHNGACAAQLLATTVRDLVRTRLPVARRRAAPGLCATRCGRCGARPPSRWRPSRRSRWGSARPWSSPTWSSASCCGRCRSTGGDRLVSVWNAQPRAGPPRVPLSAPDFVDFRDRQQTAGGARGPHRNQCRVGRRRRAPASRRRPDVLRSLQCARRAAAARAAADARRQRARRAAGPRARPHVVDERVRWPGRSRWTDRPDGRRRDRDRRRPSRRHRVSPTGPIAFWVPLTLDPRSSRAAATSSFHGTAGRGCDAGAGPAT